MATTRMRSDSALDNAFVHRSGGFDGHARRELDQARRILSEHPGLGLDFLYFHSEEDRDYVLSAVEND